MSDEPIDGDVPEPEPENDVIRTLREQAREGKRAQAEAEAAKRELAFVKAGIDPDDPQQGYFVRGYQGEISAEAIRSAATEAGFLNTQTATSEPQGMTEEERAAFRATSEAAAAGHIEPPAEDVYKEFRGQSWRSGESAENFGIRLAQKLEAQGEPVSYQGPFREFNGDSGITQVRANTPIARRS